MRYKQPMHNIQQEQQQHTMEFNKCNTQQLHTTSAVPRIASVVYNTT